MEPTETERVETDSMGPILVAKDRYWGAQTERSLHHFSVADDHMPTAVIRSMAVLKKAAALVNRDLGKLSDDRCAPDRRRGRRGRRRLARRTTSPCSSGRRARAPRRT